MGNWSITIQGVGAHHNKEYEKDANRLARQFVNKLTAMGHIIERADFTHGGKEDLLDEKQAHPDDQPKRNIQATVR